MILDDEIEVELNTHNYKYYIGLGYDVELEHGSGNHYNRMHLKTPQTINVKFTDVQHTSKLLVNVKCDCCGEIINKPIVSYYKSHDNGHDNDYCRKCCWNNTQETLVRKYGTTNTSTVSECNGSISGRNLAYTIDDIKRMCCDKGYTYLGVDGDETHIKVRDRISFVCTKHNQRDETSVAYLAKDNVHNCKICASEYKSKVRSKSSIDDAMEICKRKGYTLLTQDITSCDDTIYYICNIHESYGTQKTSLYGLQHYENNCKLCHQPRGENHFNWNGGTSSERDKIKVGYEYQQWIKDVFKRDNYTCQCCGDVATPGHKVILNAHHLENFADNPDLRTDLDNGITLCTYCHAVGYKDSFHDVYTTYHNTSDQFNEYLKNYQYKKIQEKIKRIDYDLNTDHIKIKPRAEMAHV